MIRDTVYGRVEGIKDAGIYSWKGIPFAKPPVGPLRWKAPVEPDAWTGTLSAKAFGHASVSMAGFMVRGPTMAMTRPSGRL